jgi:hypothetical protein
MGKETLGKWAISKTPLFMVTLTKETLAKGILLRATISRGLSRKT